uniref:F-box domain-containing protein n=1 Tax=Aegilops tauschii TaxID=37682 RepID=M8BKW6_AEGTA
MSESEAAATAAPPSPLEDDDLLREILLRLPKLPSSLPRASAVCKRWRRLVMDPRFLHSFRAHHQKEGPPILGAFEYDHEIKFHSILDPPN